VYPLPGNPSRPALGQRKQRFEGYSGEHFEVIDGPRNRLPTLRTVGDPNLRSALQSTMDDRSAGSAWPTARRAVQVDIIDRISLLATKVDCAEVDVGMAGDRPAVRTANTACRSVVEPPARGGAT
jgi:hypothetical protein